MGSYSNQHLMIEMFTQLCDQRLTEYRDAQTNGLIAASSYPHSSTGAIPFPPVSVAYRTVAPQRGHQDAGNLSA
ncbi:hypothetical protein PsorP6_007651 [Peronosclerospora sorghi]|uniref:Uncharacterized protein n=1 Tax=Peronosclerospora sorghi TaxID=230839 RepID=A0ACC0WA89_9STRA|nr:hypothetical protein PsorP6_007651 [Peronosclerospora sorghi]